MRSGFSALKMFKKTFCIHFRDEEYLREHCASTFKRLYFIIYSMNVEKMFNLIFINV